MNENASQNKQSDSAVYHVRVYNKGDLKSVMVLYENVMMDCIHLSFNEDFIEYFTQFPGVYDNGILVAEDDGKIVGFEIVSITHQRDVTIGSIIVFLAADLRAGKSLLEHAETYCIDQKVDSIIVVPPPQLSMIFDGVDWSRFEPSVLIAKGIKLVFLLDDILSSRQDLKNLIGDKTILISMEDEIIQIYIKNDKLCAEKFGKEIKDNSTIEISKRVLMNILFGQANPIVEYARGNYSIKNKRDVFMILRFLRKIELKDSIFTSIADRI